MKSTEGKEPCSMSSEHNYPPNHITHLEISLNNNNNKIIYLFIKLVSPECSQFSCKLLPKKGVAVIFKIKLV